MKIIKEGKLPEQKIYSGTCHYCNCEVEAEKWEWSFTYDQREGNFLQIDCPTIGCGSIIESYLEDY